VSREPGLICQQRELSRAQPLLESDAEEGGLFEDVVRFGFCQQSRARAALELAA
jgi:hypothetical protein